MPRILANDDMTKPDEFIMRNRRLFAAAGSLLLLLGLADVASAQSFDYRYTKTQPGAASPGGPVDPEPVFAQCSDPVSGGLLDHGQTVLAFLAPTVAWSSTCSSEVRQCDDGALDGTFTFPSCVRLDPVSCVLPWGGTLGHDESVSAWAQAIASPEAPCVEQVRTCSDGNLSGSFTNASCTIPDDLDPDPFEFAEIDGLAFNTLATSEIVAITGIHGNVTARLSSYTDQAAFRICADAECATVIENWRTSTAPIENGRYLQVRQQSGNQLSSSRVKTVRVGDFSTNFLVRTISAFCGGVGNVCEDGTVYIGNYENRHLAVSRCDAGQTWNGSACAGTRIQRSFYTTNSGVTAGMCGNWAGTGNACRDGVINTQALVAASANYRAAGYCDALVQDGHDDWFLPAIGQIMFMTGVTTGDSSLLTTLANSAYHATSSERDSSAYWELYRASNGNLVATSNPKTTNRNLRCMRVLN